MQWLVLWLSLLVMLLRLLILLHLHLNLLVLSLIVHLLLHSASFLIQCITISSSSPYTLYFHFSFAPLNISHGCYRSIHALLCTVLVVHHARMRISIVGILGILLMLILLVSILLKLLRMWLRLICLSLGSQLAPELVHNLSVLLFINHFCPPLFFLRSQKRLNSRRCSITFLFLILLLFIEKAFTAYSPYELFKEWIVKDHFFFCLNPRTCSKRSDTSMYNFSKC